MSTTWRYEVLVQSAQATEGIMLRIFCHTLHDISKAANVTSARYVTAAPRRVPVSAFFTLTRVPPHGTKARRAYGRCHRPS
ncbi:MAG: hypothetical protein LUP91_07680, partial [Methylococcaceae bacterium]|nr:hypothetical protein [Methylococcaceae bacterium]